MAKIKQSEEDIKAEIIAASSKLFIKYGYYKTTMEDIAKAVRKGKSTLYHYFKSKDEVIVGVFTNQSNIIFSKLQNGISSLHSAKEMITEYYRIMTDEVNKTTNLFSLLRKELEDNYSLQKSLRILYDDKDIVTIKYILRYGMQTNEFQHINEGNINEIAGLISFVTRNTVMAFALGKGGFNMEYSVRTLGEIFSRGI